MRTRFDEQLRQLNVELIRMGSLCEEAISIAAKALEGNEKVDAGRVFSLENDIDQMEHDIESRCMRMLLQQQPVATDLRVISAALKMISDMERIGDQAADIGEIVRSYPDLKLFKEPEYIARMGDLAVAMIHQSVEAFLNESVGGADMVIHADDEMDSLFNQTKQDLIDSMVKDSTLADQAIELLMVAKYLEKIGDYAVNVSEWAKYLVTGVHKEYQ